VLSLDTLRHIVRNLPQVKSVLGVPMESERVAVDPARVQEWLLELKARVEGTAGDSCSTWTKPAALTI
jgi:L-lysine 2,3-aminomutase